MALKCALLKANSLMMLRHINQIQQIAKVSGAAAIADINISKIGRREIVAHGANGVPSYIDRVDIPFPAIRFKEVTPDIQALREKEKGDWHKLSIEEKKALYRASFCQTFAEIEAPTGDWKFIVGMSFMVFSVAIWVFLFMKAFVYPPLPSTFDPERQKAQLKRIIDLRMNPVEGLASKWDYEKNQWKEK